MKAISPLLLLTVLASSGCASTRPAVSLPEIPKARSPAPGIVSAGRPGLADIARLPGAGIRHVIDLTTDAETPDIDEAAAVRAAGMRYSNLPLRGAADLTLGNVQAFDALLRTANGPLLVHCASGNRVGAMAALRAAWIDRLDIDAAIDIGRQWGLAGLEAEVRRRIANPPES